MVVGHHDTAIILPVVLCGCQTWSLILRDKHRLRMTENIGLRKMFRPKRNEVTGEWRRIHKEEFNNLYSSLNIHRVIKLRRMRWARHVARIGGEVHKGFWWETWGKESTWKTEA